MVENFKTIKFEIISLENLACQSTQKNRRRFIKDILGSFDVISMRLINHVEVPKHFITKNQANFGSQLQGQLVTPYSLKALWLLSICKILKFW